MSFFSEYRQVSKLLQQKQQVVFYAESRHYYAYYERLVRDLLAEGTVEIYYITSDANDDLLKNAPAQMKVVYVKWLLGFLFSRIQANVMIMTMPDLGNFLFKRSAAVGCYVYMFHAAVSTHQQYRQKAFFNYDCIFCTGDYQQKEIRAAEKRYSQPVKEIIGYGYPLFDEVKRRTVTARTEEATMPTILVAPSWFDGCIFDICLEELLAELAVLPYRIILRSHPEYEKRKRKEHRRIQKFINAHPSVSIDEMPNVMDRLPGTDILITDRSGIAFEFAFGVGKPVLFVETKLKQTNPDWKELGIIPVENSLREKLGVLMQPTELDQLPKKIRTVEKMSEGFKEKMMVLGDTLFYNSAETYKKGLDHILTKTKGN